jgi:hypothetical protein
MVRNVGSFRDLTGQKFGRLTVLERVQDYISPKGQRHAQWLCECDCANKVVVRGSYLKNGNTKSCGCLDSETTAKRNKDICKKYNTYDLNGEYGIGYTSKCEEFYFDLEDYDKIKDYCWYLDKDGYVVSHLSGTRNNRQGIKMHRLLFPESEKVDHIKHINNDNRKSELRPVTASQNCMNRGLLSNNTSGITGVSYSKTENRWIAHIAINNEQYQKRFIKFDDAVKQRKEWEEKYFGEYSYDNSMKGAM